LVVEVVSSLLTTAFECPACLPACLPVCLLPMKSVVMLAVESNGLALQHACARLRADEAFLSVCLSTTAHTDGSISDNVVIVLYTSNCFLYWHVCFVCVCIPFDGTGETVCIISIVLFDSLSVCLFATFGFIRHAVP